MMLHLTRPCLPLMLLAALVASATAAPDPEGERFFESRIRPIFAVNCDQCHDAKKHKGDLRLDSLAAILQGGITGPAIVPGHPEKSLLIAAVRHTDPDLKMPKEKLDAKDIADLEHWVKIGAPWPGAKADAPVRRGQISEEDRAYWFFQPLTKPNVPQVKQEDRVANPVDAFLLEKLEDKGLSFSPPADKLTLIRRATYDLTGLPPTPQEIDSFLADHSSQAFEKVIDRLLASPRYGERQARRWLDLVRYADSDGFKADDYRPEIWRYRDWVIDAFNRDLPYDQFVVQQLAGDEAYPGDPAALTATGYLRLWPYEYNQRDVRKQWNEIIDDVTGNAGEVFLGLSMHCARCHNHKFDPILQEDYFKLRAFFAPILPDDSLTAATPAQRAEYEKKLKAWQAATADIRAKIEAIEGPVRDSIEKPAIVKYTDDLRKVLETPAEKLAPLDQQLKDLAYRQILYEHRNIAGKIKGEKKTALDKLHASLREFDSLKPAPLTPVTAVRDVGPAAPPTSIPTDRSEKNIAPGTLAVLGSPLASFSSPTPRSDSTGRRLALAKWLTRPDNALSTRVIVNRLWQQHFGIGIVPTANDFGKQGEKPTHPELLDWLANEFVARGWSVKQFHKLVMLSQAYQQGEGREARRHEGTKGEAATSTQDSGLRTQDSGVGFSTPDTQHPTPDSVDPDNHLLWRQRIRRLEAEEIRDAMLLASGELDLAEGGVGGPGVADGSTRRSIYLKFLRNNRPEMIELFDGPDGFNSVAKRNLTTIAPQALMLINGDWTLGRATKLAGQVRREAGGSVEKMVELAYRKAVGRGPTAGEIRQVMEFLQRRGDGRTIAEKPAPVDSVATPQAAEGGIAVDFRRKQRMELADAAALKFEEFTVEAVFMLRSIDENANVRVIASQWDGSTEKPGWSLGVTGAKSKFQPQTLILQLVGRNSEDQPAYDVVVSGLKPQLNRRYHVMVSVKLSEIDSTGITFQLKSLADNAPAESASIGHTVVKGIDSPAAFVIGGRDSAQAGHGWDGLLDDVRLYSEALTPQSLIGGRNPRKEAVIGDWRFEPEAFEKDFSGKGRDLKNQGVAAWTGQPAAKDDKPAPAVDAAHQAFVDFCHVLLNSNEFLYID